MRYSYNEINALNLLSDNPEYSKRFKTPKDLKVVTAFILAALAIALTVAILFKVDKIVPAKGFLETKAELFAVRNTQQGFVSKVHFKEGEAVAVGDLLVEFDTRLLDLDIQSLQQDVASLSRSLWSDVYQLQPVLSFAEYNTLVTQLVGVENPFVELGWAAILLAPLNQSLEQVAVNLVEIKQQQAHTHDQLSLAQQSMVMERKQLQRVQDLVGKGIESTVNLEQQQRQVLNGRSNIASLEASLAELATRKQMLNTDKDKLTSDYVLERMVRFYDNLDRYQQTQIGLQRQQRVKQDMVVRASINGTVDGVAIRGPGELIGDSTTLMTLRPEFKRNDLEIEIEIPSSFAVWVEQGMEFRASAQGNNPDDHY